MFTLFLNMYMHMCSTGKLHFVRKFLKVRFFLRRFLVWAHDSGAQPTGPQLLHESLRLWQHHRNDSHESRGLWQHHSNHSHESLRLWQQHDNDFHDNLRLCHDRVSDFCNSLKLWHDHL